MNITQLPFPRHAGMAHKKDYILPNRLILSYGGNAFYVNPGITVQLVQSQNHGIVCIPEGVAPNGQRLFRN